MAKVTNNQTPTRPPYNTKLTAPISMQADWEDFHTAPETQDNGGSTVVNPSALNSAAHIELNVNGRGTMCAIRLKYDASTQDPVVQVFGKDGNGSYQALVNSNDDNEVTLETPATDVSDGTFLYTTVKAQHVFDMRGSQSIILGIKTPITGATAPVVQALVF